MKLDIARRGKNDAGITAPFGFVYLCGGKIARLMQDADVPVGIFVYVAQDTAEEITPRGVGETDGYQNLWRIQRREGLPFGLFCVHAVKYTIPGPIPQHVKFGIFFFAHLGMLEV